jgi:hypothetical protein
MNHLVLSPRQTGDSQRMWRAAIDAGWQVERVQTTDWSAGYRPEVPAADVVLYGESMFVTSMAERIGVRLHQPADDVLAKMPMALTHRVVCSSTLARATEDASGFRFPAFVKPAGEKAFAARVYRSASELAEVSAWMPPETAVLVSEPVKFEVEYRTFVSGRRVHAASLYIRDGALADDEDQNEDSVELLRAVAFAEQVARQLPPMACVLDVGIIQRADWAVVELNPCWASGLCGCDARQVLHVVRASMELS